MGTPSCKCGRAITLKLYSGDLVWIHVEPTLHAAEPLVPEERCRFIDEQLHSRGIHYNCDAYKKQALA